MSKGERKHITEHINKTNKKKKKKKKKEQQTKSTK